VTPERWQQVEHLCLAALDRAPGERSAFLDRECAGDAELRREVESLLAEQSDAESLLQRSAWEAAGGFANAQGAQPQRFERGHRLGPFEINELIGIGGMGEVYRARDTRLGRTVALKLLPPEAAADPERRARLEREARAVSALSHPHICALFDIGSEAGVDYLVLEYLEGETLAERLARRATDADAGSPLRLRFDEALEFGAQIADALSAAHDHRIVHRDLKPGNVMLTSGGVKLLDFGLAKTRPLAGIAIAAAQGVAPVTVPGVVLGTVNYMAPEQLLGKETDARADLFAFGALIYEMLTGRRAFEGSTPASVIASILERNPPPASEWQPLAPPALDRLVRGCLAKDPDQRWDSARLAAQELRRIAADAGQRGASSPVAGPARRGPSVGRAARWWVLAPAALTVLSLFLVARAWQPPSLDASPKRVQRLDLDLGRGFDAQVRGATALLSPDGSRIAFSGRGGDGASDLFIRRVDQAQAVALHTGASADPVFSPDGQWIGFLQGGRLKKVNVGGGSVVELCSAPTTRGMSWGDDGYIVVALGPSAGLSRVPAAGGTPVPLTTLDASRREVTHRWPQVLPGSQVVLFTAHTFTGRYDDASIEAVEVKSGERKTLYRGGYFGRYLPSGHLVFARRNTLFAAPMDLARLELTGPAVPVLDSIVGEPDLGHLEFTCSTAGDALALTGQRQAPKAVPAWRDQAGGSTPLPMPAGEYADPRASPDGQRVALTVQEGPTRQVVVYERGRENPFRLVSEALDLTPVWAPDGRHLVFGSDVDRGIHNLYWRRADGAGGVHRLTRSQNIQYAASLTRDGRLLAYVEIDPLTGSDIWVLPLDLSDPHRPVPGTPRPILRTPASEDAPAFSPDGRWLAYASSGTGQTDVYVQAFEDGRDRWQVSREGGLAPVWSRDGRQIFFQAPDRRLMVVDVTVKTGAIVTGLPRRWADWNLADEDLNYTVRDFDPAPDGRRMLALAPVGGPPWAQPRVAMTLLENFFDEVRRLAPLPR
jgi:serine/threonine protein kinase/Tol biopolymer transport system component